MKARILRQMGIADKEIDRRYTPMIKCAPSIGRLAQR